jgi:hypothetical protein
MSEGVVKVKGNGAVKDVKPDDSSRLETLEIELSSLKQRFVALADANRDLATVIDVKRKRIRDFWPIAMGLLTFGLALTFAYQVWKAAEVTGVTAEIRKMLEDARSDRAKQSQLAGDLTQAIVLLSLGYRDDARGRQGSAFRRAEQAITRFDRWTPYVDATHNQKLFNELSAAQLEEFDAVRYLLPAVEEAIVAGYELQGRSGFFLMNGPNAEKAGSFREQLEVVGRRIISLNNRRWTGPHFLALAFDKASKLEKRGSKARKDLQAEAEKLYEKSVELDPAEGALDLMNYAEAQLMEGNFEKAKAYSERYIALDSLAPAEHTVACDFIRTVAKYAMSGSAEDLMAAQDAAKKVARTRFQNYDWSDYKTLLYEQDSPIRLLKDGTRMRNLLQVVGLAYHSTGRDAWSREALREKFPFMVAKS